MEINGTSAGSVIEVSIDSAGNVVASLDNGDEIVVAQIALATFASATELDRAGDNRFVENEFSGQADVGMAGRDRRSRHDSW